MAPHPRPARPVLLAAALGLLAGCDGSGAPDDVVQHPRAPEIARIVPAEEALANAQVATLDPATMNDAEIRQAIGTGPRCEFRYTSSGKPVLAVSARADGPPLGGIVKVNGHLVALEAAPAGDEGGAANRLLLVAGPIRMTVTPDRGEQAAERGATTRRDADLVFEIGQNLRVGYSGYLNCGAEPPVEARQR